MNISLNGSINVLNINNVGVDNQIRQIWLKIGILEIEFFATRMLKYLSMTIAWFYNVSHAYDNRNVIIENKGW